MTNINKARVLLYKPRNTQYRVLHHGVPIKQRIGLLEFVFAKLKLLPEQSSWLNGCVYQDVNSLKMYTRPYEMFDTEKWEILKWIDTPL